MEIAKFVRSYALPQRAVHCFQILLASCLMGLCAQIEIPLPFTPVPLTIQTAGVMLIALSLGGRKGLYAILCYLFQGCVGLPVWAGGAAGSIHFFGPTGGYLMAYVLQVAFIGWWIERKQGASSLYVVGILLASVCLQLGVGTLWLAQFVGIEKCLFYGFYPFIAGECVKAILVTIFMKNRKIGE